MLDCVVIGAGPGGLVCTKELIEQGVREVVCLEQSSVIGGVFANTYEGLRLTSSATLSMFSDFWIGDGNQHEFWTKDEALDYWRRYAQHFGVVDRIRFNTKVVAVVPCEEGWKIQLSDETALLARRVALAIGNNATPSYPDWKDQLTDVEYSHSKAYRNADKFVGKNVLLVGGGESGSDVALGVARVARQSWVSLRDSTGWVAPSKRELQKNKHMAADVILNRLLWSTPGKSFAKLVLRADSISADPVFGASIKLNKKVKTRHGVWGAFGTKTFALPEAVVHHGCRVVDGIVKIENGGKTLHTAAGEILRDIDAVVFSTGYKNFVPFLPEGLQATDPRSLYKHMFHSKYQDKIVWIGSARPNFGSQFPIMEIQARFFAMICTGERVLPAPAEMERVTGVDREACFEQFDHHAHRLRSLVDFRRYMDDIAGLIGCSPLQQQKFFADPRIWLRIIFAATQAIQFRLHGPGNKQSMAKEMLMKLPVVLPTELIKASFKGYFHRS